MMVVHESAILYLRHATRDTPRVWPPLAVPVGGLIVGMVVDAAWPLPTGVAAVLMVGGTTCALLGSTRPLRLVGLLLLATGAGAARHGAATRHAPAHDIRRVWPATARPLTVEGRVIDARPAGHGTRPMWLPPRPGGTVLLDLERAWTRRGPRPVTGVLQVDCADGPLPERGHCIRVRGLPRPDHTDGQPRLNCAGPPALARVDARPPALIDIVLRRARARATDAMVRGLTAEVAQVQRAIVLGQRSDLDADTVRPFRKTGLAHVLALSGMHVGIITAALWALARACRLRRRWAAVGLVVVLVAYGAVIDLSPSASRALTLVIIGCSGIAGRRVPDGLNSLCAAAAILLVWHPTDLARPGFQLSFVVTAGILLGLPMVREWIPRRAHTSATALGAARARLTRGLATTLCVSGVAWLAGAPLIARHFGTVHPYGAPLAVVFVPALALALMAGFAKLAAGMCWASTVNLSAPPVEACTRLALGGITWLERLPGCSVPVTPPTWTWIALYYAGLALACGRPWRGRRATLFGLTAVLGTMVVIGPHDADDDTWVARTGGVVHATPHTVIAVDPASARDFTALAHAAGRPARGDLVLTTDEHDRLKAAATLIDNDQVATVWLPQWVLAHPRPGTPVARLLERCRTHGITVRGSVAGTRLTPPHATAQFVWPPDVLTPGCSTADRAVAVLVGTPPRTQIIAGDLTPATARALYARGVRARRLILTRPPTDLASRAALAALGIRDTVVAAPRENLVARDRTVRGVPDTGPLQLRRGTDPDPFR